MTLNESKNKRSKASLYKLSDPHKFDNRDEWGDLDDARDNRGDGNYKADLSQRNKRRSVR